MTGDDGVSGSLEEVPHRSVAWYWAEWSRRRTLESAIGSVASECGGVTVRLVRLFPPLLSVGLARHFKCGISFGERAGAATAYLFR
jgi:hypothetical protein